MDGSPRITADWFDGRSARARPVEVWLDGKSLHYGEHSAPLAGLTWPERQRHGQRQILLPGGGLLSVADGPAFDAWAQASGRGDSLVVQWQQSWRLALMSLVLLVAGLAAAYRWGLPWAVDKAVDAMPLSAERSLGEQVLHSLDGDWLKPSGLKPEQQQAWRQRWSTVVVRARANGGPALPERFEIHFRDGGKALGPNAFALPGGDIVITDALLELLADEPDAVMTVLAHETGHVRHRHGLRLMLRAGAVSIVASVIVGDFSALLASAPAVLAGNAYSRDNEREADFYGRALARAGGADTSRMAAFFERLAKKHQATVDNHPLAIAISTHPADEERVRFFSER
ncbi:Zn-dependent protease with chaperone function [Pelomonas saccharophila]|uniref:Zn-dependent protease with chaperone function n=1 Tax=Roseateles saccharophilus TaxID=304 RepID=A0ABU1YNM5_ROSSA|nr:M48 family metallopeptidase [Roseateles saccharophilus]MDR7269825.1 Zn-dependent protease with chaperone function [Roseateles saccharophilus]